MRFDFSCYTFSNKSFADELMIFSSAESDYRHLTFITIIVHMHFRGEPVRKALLIYQIGYIA